MRKCKYFIILITLHLLYGCSNAHSLEVTATAYTSNANETDSTPSLAAWGDTLKPGMKAIAVSRDLIKMGLGHGVEVSIEGFEGKYKVLDKMNKRWKRKIDIYMGKDTKKAKEWGKRKVIIHWANEPS
jgi:3D (Asp-Asp-Asp) domain-containing protein